MQLLRIDWNVVWTIINLLVLFVALRHFLYNPVMKVMDERKKMIDGQIADAENQKKQAGELKAQYAKKLEEAHAESADIMDKARKSAQAEYEKIMKKDQELLQRSQAMIAEFEKESITKSSEVTQSIISYIQEYNSNAKYDFILTKMGGNMLYSNEGLDITKDVVKGLNAKYSAK